MNNEPMSVLDHCKEIVTHSVYHPLDEKFFNDAAEDLAAVSAVLSTTPVQTALFTLLLEECSEGYTSITAIAEKIKCGKIQFLKYLDDFEAMEQKHLIRADRDYDSSFSKHRGDGRRLPSYTIPMNVIKALRTGKKFSYAPYVNLSPEEFFETANELFGSLKEDEITRDNLASELRALFQSNRSHSFVKNLKTFSVQGNSVPLLLFFCCAYVVDDQEKISGRTLKPVLSGIGSHRLEKYFRNHNHELFHAGLIENDCDRGIADTEYFRLTTKAKDLFLADVDLKEKRKRSRNLISAETLKPQDLFYSEKTARRVEELKSLLREENFAPIKMRLEERNLRSGFTCMFSGPPGTGKTENAIQNIILQEMEDLAGGILIATTNMAVNLDKAFERRFLYKIEFEKPDTAAKTAIWQSKLPGLTGADAAALAARFDFSGGQIENITRKETVSSLLSGKPLSLEDLMILCEEELLGKEPVKIGFCA